jgi:hypothetical protein
MYRKREQARRGQEHGVFARFRYIDLKEAARGCGGRGPLWELNGVEWCCEGTPGLCRRARQTAAGAWKVVGAKKCREQSVWGSREKRFVWRQGTGGRSVPKHAKYSCCRESFHAAAVTAGGERS